MTRMYPPSWAISLPLLTILLCGLAAPAQSGSNPIVIENQQPGSSQWKIPWGSSGTDSVGQIKGYASAVSVNKGQNITFYVSVNPAQNYIIDVYRMGWYQGLGGRLMQHIGPLAGVKQSTCPTDPTTGLIACQWAASYTLTTQTSWTDGIYLALLTNSQGFLNYIQFAVRDDNRVAALYYQQPVTTYQAYNNYPDDNATGKSLYAFNSHGTTTVSGAPNAVKVSFDRPYADDGQNGNSSQGFLEWEFPLVRWMEMMGYDVTYATDIDTHINGNRLLNYNGILSGGHDEYWTKQMFDAFFAARDAGVNLAFFGANVNSWQARLESSGNGVPNRVLVCYRSTTTDPITDPTLKTVGWRDAALNRPEQTLVGVQYNSQVPWTPQGFATYVVKNSSHWVYAGSGFKDGDTVPFIVGYEADSSQYPQYPLPNSVPGTYVLLSQSPYLNGSTPTFSNSSIYQAPSGAWVFASGTMSWSWALDNSIGLNLVDARIQQTTANVLNMFVTPRNDFSITTSPSSQSVLPGGNTSYTITITPAGSFTGQVSLSVSGLPAGAANSFSSNPATASSTLSVTTGTSTPSGSYTLTITGTSGSLTHTTTVSLTVNPLPPPPDFSLSASPASQSVIPGGSTSYTVTITPISGFTGQVNLTLSGQPGGATGTFSPNPATGSSTLSVTTTTGTAAGSYALTITGTSGSLTHTTAVTLVVSSSSAVKFDNSVSSDFQWGVTQVTTPAFLVGSGPNRAAMIMVVMAANNATNINASLGGVAGTLIPGTDSGTTGSMRTMIFQVINPPSGSQTATVSWTTSMAADVGVITVSGANQTTPTTNGTFVATNSAPALTTSLTINSNPGDLTASVAATTDVWLLPLPTIQTLTWGLDQSAAGGDIGPGTGTTTHTWPGPFTGTGRCVSGANFKAF